jgi:hypothetical protein
MGKIAGDPGMTRTCDLRFRKPPLYPAELRDRAHRRGKRRRTCGFLAGPGFNRYPCGWVEMRSMIRPRSPHTYATMRIFEGVSIFQIAANMGTSVEMLEDFYGKKRMRDPKMATEVTKDRRSERDHLSTEHYPCDHLAAS